MLNTGINLNTTNESILHYLALVFTYFHEMNQYFIILHLSLLIFILILQGMHRISSRIMDTENSQISGQIENNHFNS
jgi:hypothetical protein